MTVPFVLRAAQFQAAWYFSLLLATILLLVVVGSGYALVGARGLWRDGQRGPAAAVAAGTVFGFIALASMYAVAIGGLLSAHSGS